VNEPNNYTCIAFAWLMPSSLKCFYVELHRFACQLLGPRIPAAAANFPAGWQAATRPRPTRPDRPTVPYQTTASSSPMQIFITMPLMAAVYAQKS